MMRLSRPTSFISRALSVLFVRCFRRRRVHVPYAISLAGTASRYMVKGGMSVPMSDTKVIVSRVRVRGHAFRA